MTALRYIWAYLAIWLQYQDHACAKRAGKLAVYAARRRA